MGWNEVGRSGQKYRVIAIKENKIDPVFQDKYQVAGQPIRRGRKDGKRRRPEQG